MVAAATRLGGRVHVTAAAHVAEGALACTVRAAARHTRDTRHSAAGAPRLSGRLVAGLVVHGVRLASDKRETASGINP